MGILSSVFMNANRAGGNAPLIAERIAGEFLKEDSQKEG
jgi:hypothetical protein